MSTKPKGFAADDPLAALELSAKPKGFAADDPLAALEAAEVGAVEAAAESSEAATSADAATARAASTTTAAATSSAAAAVAAGASGAGRNAINVGGRNVANVSEMAAAAVAGGGEAGGGEACVSELSAAEEAAADAAREVEARLASMAQRAASRKRQRGHEEWVLETDAERQRRWEVMHGEPRPRRRARRWPRRQSTRRLPCLIDSRLSRDRVRCGHHGAHLSSAAAAIGHYAVRTVKARREAPCVGVGS